MPCIGKPRILVCPLDWGLGHATRCIPVIRHIRSAGAEVIIASEGAQLKLLKEEFPEYEFVEFPGYRIRYSNKTGISLWITLNIPRLIYKVLLEHVKLKRLIKSLKIDAVISDNRYGLWNRNISTVFITHQLNIIAPSKLKFTEPLLRIATRFFVKKYDHCWIPDFSGDDNFSGKLSHGYPIPENTSFIGILSRFDKQITEFQPNKYDIVAIISGPEPQRSLFTEILTAQLPVKGKKCLLVKGLPGNTQISGLKENLDVADHLTASQLFGILSMNPILISRSGYTTIMDIAFTGNKTILVPTPGQTEQEYLASEMEKSQRYLPCNQNKIKLDEALQRLENMESGISGQPEVLYHDYINRFIDSLNITEHQNL